MTPAREPVATAELSGVARGYRRGKTVHKVVEACDLIIPEGQLTVMIGPSGCGKSTIARLIAGYERPDAGQILIDSRPVAGPGPDRLMVFQENALFPWMTSGDNALFGLRETGRADADGKRRTRALLDYVGLGQFERRYPAALSGGMQRRLELVRALVNEPRLLILDEPFRGLDAMTRSLMQEHLAEMMSQMTRTTLFITTDIDEAILLADRILVMAYRPTRVSAIIDVDLPQPRRMSTIFANDAANAIKARALEVLHAEAAQAFRRFRS